MGPVLVVVFCVLLLPAIVIGGVTMYVAMPVLKTWIKARAASAPVALLQLLGMRLRKIDPIFITESYIRVRKAGVDVSVDDLEAHIMSGGDVEEVVDAIISADKAGINVTFDQLAAIDLAGRNVRDAVDSAVNPRVIVCPPTHAKPMMGVAQDGIRLSARVRVTVRADVARLVGAAGEQTVMARVGEGIVTAIGRCASHKDILQSPEMLAQYILSRGLDAGTAYDIVSVDIADIDVLDNIGARLTEEQAEADNQVAQARAEMRRAAAIATERENLAVVYAHTATVTAAQANIPLALSESCRIGHIWRSPNPVAAGRGRRMWDVLDR
jgi:uncharacterized protein YqfA (UPF0365 family)